jgi:hypothetical protein
VLEDKPNRDIIERAEDLILRLREVQSARIYTDEQGAISEIHVVAATERAPKLIARDVESCLKAALGVTVDYRKIGVVVIERGKVPPAHLRAGEGPGHTDGHEDERAVIDLEEIVDERLVERPGERPVDRMAQPPVGRPAERPATERPADRPAEWPRRDEQPRGSGARLEFLENDVRVRFKGLRVSIEEDRVDVEVRLAKGALEVTGSQGDFRFRGKLYETIAGATIHAISELLDENIHLCLSGVEEVSLGGRMALCAVVSALDGRSATSCAGCALIGEERNESAVLAVLDALNRPLGRWKLRTKIHYTIR